MNDMLKMFAPSASTPPSLKMSACTSSTQAMTIAAAPGPISTAASTPPSKCPEVPPATGKFSICAANTNAALKPISGILLRGSVRLTWRAATASPPADSAPVTASVLASRKPSGMCIMACSRELFVLGVTKLFKS